MLKTWAYQQYLRHIGVGLTSALITVALSFLPFSDLLQALWIFASTIFIATRSLKSRLNEGDEARFRRLYEERVKLWSRLDPDVLKALFSQNLSDRHLAWLDAELGLPLSTLEEVHALDSLARAGDQPGQLSLRAALLLGEWRAELERGVEHTLEEGALNEEGRLEGYRERLISWTEAHTHLLGEQLAPGLFIREIKLGEQRPIGVHLLSPSSDMLFTYEERAPREGEEGESHITSYSVALSLSASRTQGMSEEAWSTWRDELYRRLPMFQRAHNASGPQRRDLPFFIQPKLSKAELNLPSIKAELQALYSALPES
jgi:hypothetical protein